MEMIVRYLDSIHSMSDACKEHFASVLKTKELPKKEILLRAGHICQSIYFIQKGLLRCYYYKNEVEICSSFNVEGEMVVSTESFFKQSASYEYIQALEDCELHYISYKELKDLYNQFPEFNIIARILMERCYCRSERRVYAIRMMRASERYGYLLEHHQNLVARVPDKYLASYLGITPEMLCKIKAGKNNS